MTFALSCMRSCGLSVVEVAEVAEFAQHATSSSSPGGQTAASAALARLGLTTAVTFTSLATSAAPSTEDSAAAAPSSLTLTTSSHAGGGSSSRSSRSSPTSRVATTTHPSPAASPLAIAANDPAIAEATWRCCVPSSFSYSPSSSRLAAEAVTSAGSGSGSV